MVQILSSDNVPEQMLIRTDRASMARCQADFAECLRMTSRNPISLPVDFVML